MTKLSGFKPKTILITLIIVAAVVPTTVIAAPIIDPPTGDFVQEGATVSTDDATGSLIPLEQAGPRLLELGFSLEEVAQLLKDAALRKQGYVQDGGITPLGIGGFHLWLDCAPNLGAVIIFDTGFGAVTSWFTTSLGQMPPKTAFCPGSSCSFLHEGYPILYANYISYDVVAGWAAPAFWTCT